MSVMPLSHNALQSGSRLVTLSWELVKEIFRVIVVHLFFLNGTVPNCLCCTSGRVRFICAVEVLFYTTSSGCPSVSFLVQFIFRKEAHGRNPCMQSVRHTGPHSPMDDVVIGNFRGRLRPTVRPFLQRPLSNIPKESKRILAESRDAVPHLILTATQRYQ